VCDEKKETNSTNIYFYVTGRKENKEPIFWGKENDDDNKKDDKNEWKTAIVTMMTDDGKETIFNLI